MTSLRVRLLVGTALGTTAVLVVSGAVLYALISGTLRAGFDDALAARARSLTALAEQEEDGLEFELVEAALPEFEPSDHAEYYQVWLVDGSVFARSPSLLDENLERISGTFAAPAFQTVRFPDGRPGRLAGMTFVPRPEFASGHQQPPMTVTLVVGRDSVGLGATLARVRGLLIGVCLSAVALSGGVLAWVVRRSMKPVGHLTRQIADVGEGDLSARIDAARIPHELSPVVERLNDLLARLEAAFQRERRFTGDVAHELRTPLAGLRSKLEVALARDRAPGEYRESMGDCLEINLQMQRMVENLLHLARADAGRLEIRREQVDLSQAVRECWQPLEETANARGLSVEYRLNEVGAVETDGDKLRLVLQNVMENAALYTGDQGSISFAATTQDGSVVLAVSNSGSALSAEQVRHVFERFWRGDASCQEAGESHCGLGLPLCRALIEQLGGSIDATADAAGIFTVTIRLPRAVRPADDRAHCRCGT